VHQQVRQSIVNANRLHELVVKSEVEHRVTAVQIELAEIQKPFENLSNKAGNETQELRKHK
jgi:hypothetical protein